VHRDLYGSLGPLGGMVRQVCEKSDSLLFHYFESFLLEYKTGLKDTLVTYVQLFRKWSTSTEKDITPGIIAVIQSLGSRINFHPHLHFLVTEEGTDKKEQFNMVSQFNDPLFCRYFSLEVFSLLLRKQLLGPHLS